MLARSARPRASATAPAPALATFHEHALTRGVNPFLYWPIRAVLLPLFLIYSRMQRIQARQMLVPAAPQSSTVQRCS